MILSDALARIRRDYLDDDGSEDRFSDAVLTPWLDEARRRVWSRYCASCGGAAFERELSGNTDANGLLSLAGDLRVRRVRVTESSGEHFYDVQRIHRFAAREACSGLSVEAIVTELPGVPSAGSDEVWPDQGTLTTRQSGVTRELEELLLRTTAEYALVKDSVAAEALRRANKEAWDDVVKDLEIDSGGATSVNSQKFLDGYGWDVLPSGSLYVFRHDCS
jgi:hypothetical protein